MKGNEDGNKIINNALIIFAVGLAIFQFDLTSSLPSITVNTTYTKGVGFVTHLNLLVNTFSTLLNYIMNIFTNVIGLLVGISVISVVFKMKFSMGNPMVISQAKSDLKRALISYAIFIGSNQTLQYISDSLS